VILLGMGLPTALLAPWIIRSAQSSGERVLRERLDESLVEAAKLIGNQWIQERSSLLRIVEDPWVVGVVSSRATTARAALVVPDSLRRGWGAAERVAESMTFFDHAGNARGTLEFARSESGEMLRSSAPALPVTFPVYDRAARTLVGRADARVYLAALAPPNLLVSGVGGSVIAIFDSNGYAPLAPASMGPELFLQDQFDWGGQRWLVARRAVSDPPLTLAFATPLAVVTQPFADAGRRVSVALLVVLLSGMAISTLVTSRITRPLERLARAADSVSDGRFDAVDVDERGPAEVRRVARAFKAMTRRLQETMRRLAQRESVAAVGEFASSLAHEVRNPLTSIRLDLERARERLDDPAKSEVLLNRALRDVERLDATVDGALRIARSGMLELGPLDVRGPIAGALASATPAFERRKARLEFVYGASAPPLIRGNAPAIEQMLLNLLLNAGEAVPSGGTATVEIDSEPDHIKLTVRDDGPGIAPEHRDRITEPFFTTKEGGTGLGLPIARRIAHAHGSDLEIECGQRVGTAVSVRLVRVRS
jgi:signal transduction histidine kinase